MCKKIIIEYSLEANQFTVDTRFKMCSWCDTLSIDKIRVVTQDPERAEFCRQVNSHYLLADVWVEQ